MPRSTNLAVAREARAMEDPPAFAHPLTKAEFGSRLRSLCVKRGWSQSDLARETGKYGSPLGRDSISTYVTGKTWPRPGALKQIADCFGMRPEELLPNAAIEAEAEPAIELREAAGQPGKVLLRFNRVMSLGAAAKIVATVDEDQREPA